MSTLLIVCNLPSENTKIIADAVYDGARELVRDDVEIILKEALETQPDDVLCADAVIIGTTENFGYMSGRIKDFFERIYYPCLEKKQGMPYALYIKAGQDGTGARSSVEKIVTGLRWKQVQPVLLMRGDFQQEWLSQCKEFGMFMGLGVESNIF